MIQLTLTLKVTTTQVVKMSVTVNNSPIQDFAYLVQDFAYLDEHIPPMYDMIQRSS